MNENELRLQPGMIVKHFKRGYLPDRACRGTMYLYKIIGFAEHTETKEPLAIYQALYGDQQIYARPLDMFLSEVDREKYSSLPERWASGGVAGSRLKKTGGL